MARGCTGIRSLGHEFTPMGWGFWPELYSYVHDSVKPLRLDTEELGQIHDNFSVFNNTEFLLGGRSDMAGVFHFLFGNDC